MDKSLDQIIKERKLSIKHTRIPKREFPLRKTHKTKLTTITDARFVNIEKNRSKIRDARDVLNELRSQNIVNARENIVANRGRRNNRSNRLHRASPRFSSKRNRKVVRIPEGYVDYDNMDQRMEEEKHAYISRTFKNYSKSNGFGSTRRDTGRGYSTNVPFHVHQMPETGGDTHVAKLPPRPPTKKDPTVALTERMHTLRIDSKAKKPERSTSKGFRVMIYNFPTNVTEAEIRDLFETIGSLYKSRIVRPGEAEVFYHSLADAEKAVEVYHDRLLDDLPMTCVLDN